MKQIFAEVLKDYHNKISIRLYVGFTNPTFFDFSEGSENKGDSEQSQSG